MTNIHQDFKNPSIEEAVCEIHFKLKDENSWSPKHYSHFFSQVSDEFSEFEPISQMEVKFSAALDKQMPATFSQSQKMRYKHSKQNLTIQLSKNTFSVNILSKYVGWENMKKYILQYWDVLIKTYELQEISRIGLRYINKIEKESQDDLVGKWIEKNEYVPETIINSSGRFFLRLEKPIDKQTVAILTLGEAVKNQSKLGSVIFDIDCVYEKPTESTTNIDSIIEGLHENVWAIFSKSISKKLASRMAGD